MAMGGSILSQANLSSASISAVVTRADGRVERLGVVSYYSKNPLKRWAVNFWIKTKEAFR
jgi:hypothetical protein